MSYIVATQEVLAAGDRLAHELAFREHSQILSTWWRLRGGHELCTVCNGYTIQPERIICHCIRCGEYHDILIGCGCHAGPLALQGG